MLNWWWWSNPIAVSRIVNDYHRMQVVTRKPCWWGIKCVCTLVTRSTTGTSVYCNAEWALAWQSLCDSCVALLTDYYSAEGNKRNESVVCGRWTLLASAADSQSISRRPLLYTTTTVHHDNDHQQEYSSIFIAPQHLLCTFLSLMLLSAHYCFSFWAMASSSLAPCTLYIDSGDSDDGHDFREFESWVCRVAVWERQGRVHSICSTEREDPLGHLRCSHYWLLFK